MRLGVDFGTTRTTVAAVDRGNYPVVSFEDAVGDTREYIPSLAALDGDRLVYGYEALSLAQAGAPHLRSFKRTLAGAAVTGDSAVRIGARAVPVLEVLSGFLSHVAHQIRTASSLAPLASQEPLRAVVAVPAHAYSGQRFLTLEAFRAAGFDVVAMLNEPSAAGFEYTHRHSGTLNSRRTRVLVYDLGGGTFDASLVNVRGRDHDVQGSLGDNTLGGDDFDTALARVALDHAGVPADELDAATYAGVVDQARDAKERLLPQSKKIVLDISGREITVPVSEFYEAASPLVDRTVQTMEPLVHLLAGGALKLGDDVAGLYLVGGASQLPLVGRVLRQRFGRRVHRSPYPAASTAIGLAIAADEDAGYTLTDRLSRGLGVFREQDSGRELSFDPLLAPGVRVTASGSAAVTRDYRPAHNVGWFRYVEYTRVGSDGVPTGDVKPCGRLAFPFDPALQRPGMFEHPERVPVVRRAGTSEVRERYEVDPRGVVTLRIADLATGYAVTRTLGQPAPPPQTPGAPRR